MNVTDAAKAGQGGEALKRCSPGAARDGIKQKKTPNSERLGEQRAFASSGRERRILRGLSGSTLCFLRYLLFKIRRCAFAL